MAKGLRNANNYAIRKQSSNKLALDSCSEICCEPVEGCPDCEDTDCDVTTVVLRLNNLSWACGEFPTCIHTVDEDFVEVTQYGCFADPPKVGWSTMTGGPFFSDIVSPPECEVGESSGDIEINLTCGTYDACVEGGSRWYIHVHLPLPPCGDSNYHFFGIGPLVEGDCSNLMLADFEMYAGSLANPCATLGDPDFLVPLVIRWLGPP